MIDYEITVNVGDLTKEEKMRVQDAFFKLGITWWEGVEYCCLDKGCYSNKTALGIVMQELMWADYIKEPTHTVDELFALAGMWTEQPVFNHWDLLLEGIKLLAKDNNDSWYGYVGKPSRGKEKWADTRYEGRYPLAALNPKLFPECNWENSLMERPENV